LLLEIISLKSAILRKALVTKGLLIIVNCLFGSRDGKLLLLEKNEKRSAKKPSQTLPQELLSIAK
jgi:hypothetical protein